MSELVKRARIEAGGKHVGYGKLILFGEHFVVYKGKFNQYFVLLYLKSFLLNRLFNQTYNISARKAYPVLFKLPFF